MMKPLASKKSCVSLENKCAILLLAWERPPVTSQHKCVWNKQFFCHCCLRALFEVGSNSWPANIMSGGIRTLSALWKTLFCILTCCHCLTQSSYKEPCLYSELLNSQSNSDRFLTEIRAQPGEDCQLKLIKCEIKWNILFWRHSCTFAILQQHNNFCFCPYLYWSTVHRNLWKKVERLSWKVRESNAQNVCNVKIILCYATFLRMYAS